MQILVVINMAISQTNPVYVYLLSNPLFQPGCHKDFVFGYALEPEDESESEKSGSPVINLRTYRSAFDKLSMSIGQSLSFRSYSSLPFLPCL